MVSIMAVSFMRSLTDSALCLQSRSVCLKIHRTNPLDVSMTLPLSKLLLRLVGDYSTDAAGSKSWTCLILLSFTLSQTRLDQLRVCFSSAC
jgi:hypothetical protein